MSAHISIKPLEEVAQEDWQALWLGYQAFYHVQLEYQINAHTWQRLVDSNQPHMYGFAACLDQQVVGIVHVIEHDSCWTEKPYAYLQDLFTAAEYRGQGIAKQLILKVKEYTEQRQCDRVYWLTHADNVLAQQLYDKVARKTGFIQYRM